MVSDVYLLFVYLFMYLIFIVSFFPKNVKSKTKSMKQMVAEDVVALK